MDFNFRFITVVNYYYDVIMGLKIWELLDDLMSSLLFPLNCIYRIYTIYTIYRKVNDMNKQDIVLAKKKGNDKFIVVKNANGNFDIYVNGKYDYYVDSEEEAMDYIRSY